MSSQLKGLTAEIGRTPKRENEPGPENAESEPSTEPTDQAPIDTGNEEDWGIESPRSGMSRETKIGFAFVLMLLVVFGFVVYKKVEQKRLQNGNLLAGVESAPPENADSEQPAPPATNDAQNPIIENSLPPVQNPDPLEQQSSDEPNATEPQPAELSQASWDEPTFEPSPNQNEQIASSPSPSNGERSTSIDQFPAEEENPIASQPEPTPAPQFPSEEPAGSSEPFPEQNLPSEQQTQSTTVAAGPATEVEEFSPTPAAETEDQFAQAPLPDEFEAPTEITPRNPPAEMTSDDSEPATSSSEGKNKAEAAFNPLGDGEETAGQLEPGPPPSEFDDEQFSAQSQPVPKQSEPSPPAEGNPFGAAEEADGGESVSSGGDPFAQPAQGTEAETEGEAESETGSELEAGSEFGTESGSESESPDSSSDSSNPDEAFQPVPVDEEPERLPSSSTDPKELAQPEMLPENSPTQNPAPIEAPPAEKAGPESFPSFPDESQPAPVEQDDTTTVQHPGSVGGSVPQELPEEPTGQFPSSEGSGEFAEAPELLPAEREAEVYVVRPGDNYWKISKKQYGTVRYFSALARYNQKQIPDPKKMRPGMKVLTPGRKVLETENPDLFPKFSAESGGNVANVGHRADKEAGFFRDAQGTPMYRVGQDDTLGGIAQKHLGRFSRWQEIYRLNRERLKDPNALTIGDVLILPGDASRVNMVRHASGIR